MDTVTLVGAGIVNLITALELARHGYPVTVHDRAPDPRSAAHWTRYGCTRGGGDGRMFTLTEADTYHNRSRHPDGSSNGLLDRPISEHGWLLAEPGSLTEPERHWAAEFQAMPPALAEIYNEDIFEVNREAGLRWTSLVSAEPELFGQETGYADGILRLYSEQEYLRWHLARNDRVGATRRVLSPDQIASDYPALADACVNGTIAGGIEVVGFTVNIHRFVARLLDLLEAEGVRFHWDSEVARIRWKSPGIVDRLELSDGEILHSRHYVLSLGAYGDDLLRGTEAHQLIQGMLGVWSTLPNVEPRLEHSLKIARNGHRAEETNVTLATGSRGEPLLVCGSGYGWTGLQPDNIDASELEVLFDSLDDTLRRFFPQAHAAAEPLGASRQVCVRPWTASCLGIFERVATAGGGSLIVTGGHNTGGFAQSPVVAEAVLASLEGRPHKMHERYDPRRYSPFISLRIT